ncbi:MULTISPECIES: glycosyltransferase family 4 protein [Priestia]|uniref:glycosyltransferase family 4 protein n=1 Tax=Priestia TaxID=2800373 RepID=UPI002D7F6821|nr:glycosyltransferase family 4 protein [Priestia megaterium]MEB4870871.1 glycosyltransferase family 4 protein [Priestia megaterium]MEB4888179.1 glycosyltransferase family 4 protein [Priestia megaterium]
MVEKVKTDKKKLLIYAHYYIPDVASTGQILRELAEGMIHEFDITIVCVVPSYTGKVADEYKKKMFYKEEINGVKVIRIRVPEFSKSNKLSRVKNILSYFIGAMIATFKVGKMDYVYSISQPPILGGLLGVWGKWMKRAKYIYNIQDFNPEQTMAVGYSKNKLVLKAMMMFDKFSCRQADKVIVVGRDMVETLKGRFKGRKVPNHTFINNWIDEKEIYPLPADHKKVVAFKAKYGLQDKFIIMYSGNLGLYYDLENLMGIIEKFKDRKDVVFAFVGEGTIRENLVQYKENHNLHNVKFIPYQDKEDLIYSLNAGDVHWCLNAKGIKGVSVPSKLYGIIAAGKPILGALEKGSEARLIIEETQCGYVTEPGNYNEVEKLIQKFLDEKGSNKLTEMSERGREYLVGNLTKDVSINKYIKEI